MQAMKFTLWDVEHGISIWIETPNGHHHWIDLGKTVDFSPTQHVAQKYSVSEIDYLIISHPDQDHIEDLPNFRNSFYGPRVLLRNKSLPNKEFSGSGDTEYKKIVADLHRRYTHPVAWIESPDNPDFNGGIEYKTFFLRHGKFDDGSCLEGNNTSIVVFTLYQGILFVCPGDIEQKGWEELWNKNSEAIQNILNQAEVRFLVAPHHGRKSGYSKHMMDTIEPHAVFISDKWGGPETHQSYYSRPLGIQMENGEIKKCFSTKTGGRILCEVDEDGSFIIDQYENFQNPNPYLQYLLDHSTDSL